ncbi:MAG: bifunctional N(6)-L-threonylcarbamoyladenine synthase/serine/threonine protein kinase [Candidatus Woesearchaeota archaeon]
MLCLGIESTAHTFGAAVVTDSKVLSNEKDSYSTDKGGIIPSEAAEHHVQVCDRIISASLKKANKSITDIDLIAFSQGPGIGHTLRIGALASRMLSAKYNIPLIGVNHCIAHLEIASLLFKCKDPILLYASGANTQIVAYEAGKYRIFGETLDIGVGNFFDCFAREIGVGFPGGPKIAEFAKDGRRYIELPYVVKGMDVSFGGLLTNLKQKISQGFNKADLAYSCQETVFAMLIEVAERALAHCEKDELVLGGGVSCNWRLQEMAKKMCKERGTKCYIPENQYLVDNGAMIAYLGILEYKAGVRTPLKNAIIKPYERTDEVKVVWR